jgi:hypothetical protein
MSLRLTVVPASSGQMARHKNPAPVKTRISAMSREASVIPLTG